MIQHDALPASADANTIADEAAPEDVTTQIVPQSAQAARTPTPDTPDTPDAPDTPPKPPRQSGAPHWLSGSAQAAPPPWPGGSGSGQAAAPNPANAARQQETPNVVPVVSVRRHPLPGSAIHAPWHTAPSWGATTFVITAETAAGFSYLFWWISGLLVYFNERENRYVRFHAVQSILLTGALSVFSVFAFTIAAIFNDLFMSTQQHIWQTLCVGTIAASLLIVALPWLTVMIAAWTGTYLQLPIVGDYAERFAAPPIQLRP